jgi:predicted dehydrogenase
VSALVVGLAGAGPWARTVHGPMLAAGPETVLGGVWARTPERAAALAAELGAEAVDRFEDLVERCEAVAFAVPPDAQGPLVVEAARRGRALLIEKPLAFSVDAARRTADAVLDAGVGHLLGLTYRYAPAVRAFLAEAVRRDLVGGSAAFLSGAYLGDTYGSSAWRVERGAVTDVGPHVLDVLDVALGPVVDVAAHGDGRFAAITLRHDGGAVSTATISCSLPLQPSRTEWEVFGPDGALRCDGRADPRDVVFATLRAELAAVARSRAPHPCGVERGVELAVLVDRVERALAASA